MDLGCAKSVIFCVLRTLRPIFNGTWIMLPSSVDIEYILLVYSCYILELQMIFVDLQRQMSYLISTYLQIANHLDRAVSNLGRNPLKILVQVNTSGEECK